MMIKDKEFSAKLESLLNDMEVPPLMADRRKVCARLFRVSAFKAGTILEGIVPQDEQLLERIARSLGVTSQWLLRHKKRRVN